MHKIRFFDMIRFAPEDGSGAGAAGAAGAGVDAGAGGSADSAGAGGAATPSFADQLPEDIRGEAAFFDIKDLGGLAKSYLNSQKLLGKVAQDPKSILSIPGADDAEGWNSFYARLGRPDAADKYVLPQPAAGQYSDADKAFQAKMLPVLHEAGLSQRQIDAIVPKWNELQQGMVSARDAELAAGQTQAVESLKADWGQAYDQNLKLAVDAIAHYGKQPGLEKLGAELDASGVGNSPALAKLFSQLGRQLSEDGVLGKSSGGADGLKTPAEAQQEIAALQKNKEFMADYTAKAAPGHAQAVERMRLLHEQAYPVRG